MLKQIHQITLNDFIRCTVENDYSSLSDDPKATPEDLQAAWQVVYEQYIDRIKDKEQVYIIKLAKSINLLQTKIHLINLCILRLGLQHSDEVVSQLRKQIAFPGKLDPNDALQYVKDLNLITNLAKRFQIDLEGKIKEYESLTGAKGSKKIGYEYFDTLIVSVSKYMKFKINRFEILMSEFVSMLCDMKAYSEKISMQSQIKTT